MGAFTSTRTTVTNINRGGMWSVIQTITVEVGGFESRHDAERWADRVATPERDSTAPKETEA